MAVPNTIPLACPDQRDGHATARATADGARLLLAGRHGAPWSTWSSHPCHGLGDLVIHVHGFADRFGSVFAPVCGPAHSARVRVDRPKAHGSGRHIARPSDRRILLRRASPGTPRSVDRSDPEIYSHVEAMEYGQAHWLAGGMVVFSFAVLLSLSLFKRRNGRIMP